jgi:hypothetical protein
MLAVLLPLCGEPLSIGADVAAKPTNTGVVASLSPDDVNFGYMLGAWFGEATQRGLMRAVLEYLWHLLSEEQLAPYRAVTRDADRFPELGQHYQKNVGGSSSPPESE